MIICKLNNKQCVERDCHNRQLVSVEFYIICKHSRIEWAGEKKLEVIDLPTEKKCYV